MAKPAVRKGDDGSVVDLRDPKSGWQDLSSIDLKKLPRLAVYQVRWLKKDGTPQSIPRLLKTDDQGLLYIGMTQARDANRIKGLLEDLQHPTSEPKHGIGKKLWRTRFNQRIAKGERIQIGWDEPLSIKDNKERERGGQIVERDKLQGYFVLYGELPPFNHQLPGFLKDDADDDGGSPQTQA